MKIGDVLVCGCGQQHAIESFIESIPLIRCPTAPPSMMYGINSGYFTSDPVASMGGQASSSIPKED